MVALSREDDNSNVPESFVGFVTDEERALLSFIGSDPKKYTNDTSTLNRLAEVCAKNGDIGAVAFLGPVIDKIVQFSARLRHQERELAKALATGAPQEVIRQHYQLIGELQAAIGMIEKRKTKQPDNPIARIRRGLSSIVPSKVPLPGRNRTPKNQ